MPNSRLNQRSVSPVTDASHDQSNEQLTEDELDSRADATAVMMIFGAAVLIAVYFISGWTPFV